jgi:pimeloyl-ACP methyl ester carboxylesterase
MKKWLKRIGLSIAALLAIALAAGTLSEQLARRRAPREFPPPGRLVDIGGRRIQIDCRGHGSPVVVFEANDLGGSLGWSAVQAEVSKTTRACSYSRAGVMWSDPAQGVRDDKAIAVDLHAVLAKAGERPPFVLVGHSLGGLYAVLYTHYFGDEVAGLVLVDPAHPAQTQKIEAITHRKFSVLSPPEKILRTLAWTGLPRLVIGSDMPKGMEAAAAFAPQSLVTIAGELDMFDKTLVDAAAWHDLGARPLIVLTAMAPASEAALQETQMSAEEDKQFRIAWKALHDDEVTWSSAGRRLLVPDSGHRIQTDRPQVVIDAVGSVVEAVRSRRR